MNFRGVKTLRTLELWVHLILDESIYVIDDFTINEVSSECLYKVEVVQLLEIAAVDH